MGDRWDDLSLRSSIDGGVLYEDGSVAANLPPSELVAAIPWAGQPPRCFVAFTGTVPVIGDIRPGRNFQAELTGPGLCTVGFHYQTHVVPPLSAP